MRSHKPKMQNMAPLLIAGAMGWALMACSSVSDEPVAQTSQADTGGCMSNADCPPGFFCDGGQEIPACFEYGATCGEGITDCGVTYELGDPIETGGGDQSGFLCADCICLSPTPTYAGAVCGFSYEGLSNACNASC